MIGDFAGAVAPFTESLALKHDSITLSLRGLAYFFAKDYPNALADLTNPRSSTASVCALPGNVAIAQGAFLTAVEKLTPCVAQTDAWAEILLSRGIAYTYLGNN